MQHFEREILQRFLCLFKNICHENPGNFVSKIRECIVDWFGLVQAIYDMLGAGAVKPTDTAEERAKNIFNR